MSLSLRFIILSGFLVVLLPALILLSYIDFTKAKADLEDNFDFTDSCVILFITVFQLSDSASKIGHSGRSFPLQLFARKLS